MGTVITLTAGDLVLVITGDRPFEGLTYNKLDSWYDLPAVDVGFVKRPGAPGAFEPEQTFPDEATISIEGDYFGSSRADALLMRERILELYNDGRSIGIEVADDLRTTRRTVKVANIDLPWTIHPEFAYKVDLKAADPRRYADAVTVTTPLASSDGVGLSLPLVLPMDFGAVPVNGRLTVANPGNAATVTTFTVRDGSMPDGFVLVNVDTGQRLTYVGPVVSGTTVTLDARMRAAFINGTSPGGRYLSAPEWWSVPKRKSVTVQFLARGPVTGTPTLSAATSPAYY
jgi:hypothetical protein